MALSQVQRSQLSQAYIEDAQGRNLDPSGMVRELLSFILASRQVQINQLLALTTRRRAVVSNLQANFETAKAAELAALDNLDNLYEMLLSVIPNIDA